MEVGAASLSAVTLVLWLCLGPGAEGRPPPVALTGMSRRARSASAAPPAAPVESRLDAVLRVGALCVHPSVGVSETREAVTPILRW